MTTPPPFPCGGAPRTSQQSLLALVAATVCGALIWGAWLGWDHTASYDVITDTVQHPYVTLQVIGCALTVGLAAALFAAGRFPLSGSGGVAAGFWVAWTMEAASTDDTGLYAVGALLLGMGLVVGVTVAAGVGLGARVFVLAYRRRHRRLSL